MSKKKEPNILEELSKTETYMPVFCCDCKYFDKQDGCDKSIDNIYITPKNTFDWVGSALEYNSEYNCKYYKRKWYKFWI